MEETGPWKGLPAQLRGRAFRLRDAVDLGVSRHQLHRLGLTKPTRSVYATDTPESLATRSATWALVLPEDAALYGKTAAELYDLPAPRDEDVHFIVPAGGTVPVRRPGLVTHEGLPPDGWRLWEGLRVSTPPQVFLQLAPELSRDDLVVVGDHMVRQSFTTPEELRTAAAAARRRRGVVLAREAASLVQDGVDSPPETRVRLILMDGGLPRPETGVDIIDEYGAWIGRPDLAYRRYKVGVQYEGDVHRTNRKRWRADIVRDERMFDAGWDVVRATGDDLRSRRHAELCQRVWIRMARQAKRLGLPRPAPLTPRRSPRRPR